MLVSLFCLQACQKVIMINLPPYQPELIVFCKLEEGNSTVTAWISSTVGILDTTILWSYGNSSEDSMKYANSYWVNNATVKLYEPELLP